MQVSSLTGSAASIITNAQQKANTAAQTIANLSVQSNEVGGSKDISSGDLFKPVLSLKEAEYQNSAGVKLLNAQGQMLGSLLDVTA